MKIKIKKPKKAESVTNLYVPGEEEVLENVVQFRSQQKQNWQLGHFIVAGDDFSELRMETRKFVEIRVKGV